MLVKVVKKLCIFFLLLIVLDVIIGFALRKIYFKQNHGKAFRTTYVMETATPNIIILGSSKAAHNYIANSMHVSLTTTCYNAGRDGYFILYSNAVLNSILQRYAPKLVLLDVMEDDFEEKSYKIEDKLSDLLPYYRSHTEIRSVVDQKSPYEKYKLLSGMYTYNTMLIPAILGCLHSAKNEEKDSGYLPLFTKWNGEQIITDDRHEKLNENKIQAFRNIIAACKEKHIPLIVVVSPSYKKYVQNYNPTVESIINITNNNHLTFWNYQADTTYLNNRNFFYDARHLNNDGATVFTNDIIKRLKASGYSLK